MVSMVEEKFNVDGSRLATVGTMIVESVSDDRRDNDCRFDYSIVER